MQNSPIMLDSAVAEVLSAAQVESTKTSPKDDSNSNSSEAEVRLVVRFIVEEHIVYKGKVEKVHQLESEELSRIVSRVAWDGAKDKEKFNKDGDNNTRVEIIPGAERNSEQRNSPTKADTTISKPTTTFNPPTSNHNKSEEKTMDQVQQKTTSNTDSSSLEAYTNSSSDSEQVVRKIEENSFAQEEEEHKTVESEPATNCDNNLERSSNHVYETENQCPSDSPSNEQIFTQDLTENFVIDIVMNNNPDYGLNSNPTPESIDDACIDSQSIADTLNDCVDNIDRECRQQLASRSKLPTFEGSERSVDSEPHSFEDHNEHNDLSNIKENDQDSIKSEIIIVETTNSNENIQEQDQKLYPVLLEECSHEEIVRSIDTPCDTNDFASTNIPLREDASSSSIKRKATGENHNLSGKRIRRGNPKERNLNTRTSTNKISENSSSKHHLATPRHCSTGSLASNNQQVRKIKVFAKWSDNHFYPGTILKSTKDRKLVIGFFDGAQRNVAETDLIPLGNIEGKQVRVSIAKNYCVNAIVHDQRSPVSDQPMFDVEYQQDGVVRKCVPLKDIFLTAEQGTPLINQVDKNSSAGNFADVDLDNIIYEKRSRRLQEMEEFYFTSSSPHRTKTSLLL